MEVVTRCMPPDMHYSALATRQTRSFRSENVCYWWQATDSAALSPCLLLGKKEEKGQVSSRHQVLRSQPALAASQPAVTDSHHPSCLPIIITANPPGIYSPNQNTISLRLPSTLKTHMKRRKHGFLKQAMHVQRSACFWPSQLSYGVTLHLAHDWHTRVPLHSS